MVTRVDRLARSIRDLQDTVYSLNQRGITLRATEQPVDTRSAAGKAFLDMLGGGTLNLKPTCAVNRQMEGIVAFTKRAEGAKVKGIKKISRRSFCFIRQPPVSLRNPQKKRQA